MNVPRPACAAPHGRGPTVIGKTEYFPAEKMISSLQSKTAAHSAGLKMPPGEKLIVLPNEGWPFRLQTS